ADLAAQVAGAGGCLVVGRDVALAAEVGAGGAQLGDPAAVAPARARLGPGALIGLSAHSLADVAAARDAGADYVTLSPVFASASKPGYGPALGLDGVRAGAALGLPVLALGGIAAGSVPECRRAGAAGVAVMGGVMRGADPAGAVRALIAAWDREGASEPG
ncbi:thiamine phosphate synthase, partial [Methylobacterium crusticola]